MPRKTSHPPSRRAGAGRAAGGGTPADRLLRAWLAEDDDAFDELAEELIAGGRDGVLLAAVRKYAEKYDDEAVEEMAAALTDLAERAEGQAGFDYAELVLLPVLVGEAAPDAQALAAGLAGAGVLPAELRLDLAAGWRTAEAVAALSPVALRRVLLDVAAGRPPADLPTADAPAPAQGDVLVLVGAISYGAAPPAEDPDADPELLAARAEARTQESMDAFDRWRDALPEAATGGSFILPLCAPSELGEELAALLEEAEDLAPPDLEEVADFVSAAVAEAGGQEVVARLQNLDDGVEVILLTRAGLELDRRVFPALAEGPAAAEIRQAVAALVPILD